MVTFKLTSVVGVASGLPKPKMNSGANSNRKSLGPNSALTVGNHLPHPWHLDNVRGLLGT